MIEQHQNQLILTFPTADSATTFAAFLQTLLQSSSPEPAIFGLPSDPLQETLQDSQEPRRSQHTVLTDERLEHLSRQREQGSTMHQRLLRAQTTLRDGVLPFSKPGEAPQPTNQPSPRQRAQAEGGFADGEVPEKKSRLRPVKQPAVP